MCEFVLFDNMNILSFESRRFNMETDNKTVSDTKLSKTFPFYRLSGTHKQIGQQFGKACKALIHKHLNSVYEHLQHHYQISPEIAMERALNYRPYVLKYAPYLDEEIQGIAEGANLTLGEAYILQVRAELNTEFNRHNECTSFALTAEATEDGVPLVGENIDLPAFYTDVGVIIEIVPDEGPSSLMFTPAGQVSYIGINDLGLGVFGNYLNCDGWRLGLPRYMYTRIALNYDTVEKATEALQEIHRSAPQNLMMLDKDGVAVDLEITATDMAKIEPDNGMIAHTNHFIGENLLQEERSTGYKLENSQTRLKTVRKLLEDNHGRLNVEKMKDILYDRSHYPHCIYRKPGDKDQEVMNPASEIVTVVSAISKPSEGKLWIAVGPPYQYEYTCYTLESKK